MSNLSPKHLLNIHLEQDYTDETGAWPHTDSEEYDDEGDEREGRYTRHFVEWLIGKANRSDWPYRRMYHGEQYSKIDLRTCEKGDKLISIHGLELEYVSPTAGMAYYDHIVVGKDGLIGTRTHDGHVFRHNRKPEDHDIVKIIPK